MDIGTSVGREVATQADDPLASVVAINESAKLLRSYAFEVGLSALGAIVRSSRSGDHLRGFKEVASQMRGWSSELAKAVQLLNASCAESVRLESELMRRTRLLTFLEKAAQGANAQQTTALARERERGGLRRVRDHLARSNADLLEVLDQLIQLGMMASVLSRAALIEAGCGAEHERRELSLASRVFAGYADRVNEVVADARKHSRRGRS